VVDRNFTELEEEVRRRLAAQGVEYADITVTREVDARYTMQIFEVPTPVAQGTVDDTAVKQIADDFEERYASLYGKGTGFREAGIQFITYRVFGTGRMPFKPELPKAVAADGGGTPPVKERRRALLDIRAGWQEVDVYDYSRLGLGSALTGPAIVEAPTTTVVVPPGTSAVVDGLGNLRIRYQ
jgi:N-methylhydantoinase A